MTDIYQGAHHSAGTAVVQTFTWHPRLVFPWHYLSLCLNLTFYNSRGLTCEATRAFTKLTLQLLPATGKLNIYKTETAEKRRPKDRVSISRFTGSAAPMKNQQ